MRASFRFVAALALLLTLGVGASAATHTVQPGETLGGIARRYGVTVGALASANGIADPNRVGAGRRLTIPGTAAATPAPAAPRTHVVAAGDTLGAIARRYGVTVPALVNANHITNPNVVAIGRRLTIPGAAAPASTAAPGTLPLRLRQSPERLALRPRFDYWAGRNSIPSDLLQAVCWVESGWQPNQVSSAGAIGIGQLMPATVDFVRSALIGVPSLDPYKAEDNIRMSARFLGYLLRQTGGSVEQSIAAYYQGLRSVRERGILVVSRAYITAVLSHRPLFR